jgi:hypothetical protein
MVYSTLRENTALLLREKMPSSTPDLLSKSVPQPLSNAV